MNRARSIGDRLTLLEFRLERPGYEGFFGSYVYRGLLNLLVDVGPAASVSQLLDFLRTEGVHHVDAVLLTHIHLDHAGGLSAVVDAFPEVRVVCHGKAIPYLVDPDPLWEASLKTLGDVARVYGKPEPIEESRLTPHTEADIEGLTIVDTPGHAPHHLSHIFDGLMFTGEAAGVHLPEEDPFYLRPATPPKFFLEKAVASIDKLAAQGEKRLCYGHFGTAESSTAMLAAHREQLMLWRDLLDDERRRAPEDDLYESCYRRLRRDDPRLACLSQMDPARRERERFFILNSIKGYLGYLEQ
ncbi:MAG: MBL fold metallo-hydrolase [Deltaproteobacteria bacterium]|nr:MBL fold metallo-hydrolase [Deltaproteobacteria bacterium]